MHGGRALHARHRRRRSHGRELLGRTSERDPQALKPADRHLDERVVADIVREQFPDVPADTVTHVGEGWDNEVYLVDDVWMFRFPRHSDQIVWLEREIDLMPIVSGALGPLVPEFEYVGRASEAFPYPFVGYRRIDGVGADAAELTDLGPLARDLADAYTRLHAIDPELVPRTPAGWEDESWHDWRPHHEEDIDDLREALPPSILSRAEPFIAGEIEPPPVPARRVVHNDICADHVLVDPSTGRLTGLIDWPDMMVGDPVLDFVGLISVGGYDFIDEVVANYGGEIDAAFHERTRWAARTLTLHWLVDVLDEGASPDKHLLWVERAFREP